MHLDHVALVLADLEPCRRALAQAGLPLGPLTEWDGENTREIYVETAPVRILLMQPRSPDGPIARHLARRGPGFHHLAFQGCSVDEVMARAHGWETCPSTKDSLERGGPAWLLQREAEVLLELQPGGSSTPTAPSPVRTVTVELDVAMPVEADELRILPGKRGILQVDLEGNGRLLRLKRNGALELVK